MISRQPIIDAVIGPQTYHKFNKVIEEVKNKRVLELEFESKDKFKSLRKNVLHLASRHLLLFKKVVINFVVFV